MVRSMFSGVSALKAHQTRLDVIGNDLANVLTVGYKGSQTTFHDLYSQSIKGASSSTQTRGGTNPSQIGLGATVSAITVRQTRGSVQRTEVPEHLMINGNGFFVVSSDPKGQNRYYTRAGNFQLDELGFMVTTEGMYLLDMEGNPVQINKSDTENATATKYLTFAGNLNKDGDTYTTNVDVYDSLGSTHTLYAVFEGPVLNGKDKVTPDENDPLKDTYGADGCRYSYKQFIINDAKGNRLVPDPSDTEAVFVKFNEKGDVVGLVKLGDPPDPNSDSTDYSAELTIELPGAADIKLAIDRSMFFKNPEKTGWDGVRTLTQVSDASDVKSVQLYGISAGKLTSFEISSKGEVTTKYSNGATRVNQIIMLADFDNPTGLSREGNNLFVITPNSGVPKYGQPQTGSFGGLLAGALEMSNVDIGAQFTDLILTQRGLQANSRIITTSDEVLQEIVNMKR